jgi:anti-sigma factor RsiW
MNERLESGRCDEEAARLLPWYVAGRLEAGDSDRVLRHLERCPICRDDLAHERAVRTLLKSESRVQYAPQPGLAKTLARIDELEREASAPPADAAPAHAKSAPTAGANSANEPPARRVGATRWLAAAVFVQAVALGALGTAMFHRSGEAGREASYTTLSLVEPTKRPGAHIRAVFSPSLSVGELKVLLADNALTIVAGPSDASAYTLAPTDAHAPERGIERAIAALRADPRVLFAEPAVNDGAGVR